MEPTKTDEIIANLFAQRLNDYNVRTQEAILNTCIKQYAANIVEYYEKADKDFSFEKMIEHIDTLFEFGGITNNV